MDINTLLQPISTEAPCGIDMSFSNEFDAVQELRREDDATLPQGEFITELKVADWQGAADLCERLLKTCSKDLRIAGWLVESWSHLRGLSGLADGLSLVEQLCVRHWADVHPLPDDGEQELRIGNLAWVLGRVESLSRTVTLLRSDARSIGLMHVEAARARQGAAGRAGEGDVAVSDDVMTTEVIARIQRETPRDFLAANVAEAGRALDALGDLQTIVDELLGADGPGFVSARKALEAVAHAAKRYARDGGALDQTTPEEKESEDAAKTVLARVGALPDTALASGPLQSRAQALQQLRAVAEFFRRTEPHSPVAYLADKAAQWGEMPLHAWLRAVVKDSASLTQLEDLLGVKPVGDGTTPG